MRVSGEEATRVVLTVLAAKTGYEPDMIEMDMALETEVRNKRCRNVTRSDNSFRAAAQLGVDSIKRVEILSDVQKELKVEAQDVAALSRTQTVGEVVEAMIKELDSAAPGAAGVDTPLSKAAPSGAPAASGDLPQQLAAMQAERTKAEAQLLQQATEIAALKEQLRVQAAAPPAGTGTGGAPNSPVAIIGYSCILPGGENVTEAWDMIQAGLDNVRNLPDDRVDVTAYYSGSVDHNPVDKIYCTRGGFIPNFEFDPREYDSLWKSGQALANSAWWLEVLTPTTFTPHCLVTHVRGPSAASLPGAETITRRCEKRSIQGH